MEPIKGRNGRRMGGCKVWDEIRDELEIFNIGGKVEQEKK
jgi:hypothetical protein